MATILLTGHHYGDLLEDALRDRGHRVIRGPKPVEGTVVPVLPASRLDELDDVEVVVVSHRDGCTGDMIHRAPRLRGIVSTVIGVDTIDMDTAAGSGILVANGTLPENYLGVSEATVILIGVLLLRLHDKEAWLREGKGEPRHMLGRMVRGKTVGLVGLGRSARGVAARLSGWEAEIVAFDPYVSEAPAGVEMVSLDQLLRRSDVVSVHVTLTDDTRHLIGEAELASMKPDAYLINTSRGPVVDESALARALSEHRIAGAALDVFEEEPLPMDSPLRKRDNVVLTPHMVGHSRELEEGIPKVALENVLRILKGADPLYVANPQIRKQWRQRLLELGTVGG